MIDTNRDRPIRARRRNRGQRIARMARAALCVAVASTGLVVATAASPSVAAAETRGVHISVGSRAAGNRWNWDPAEIENHAKCAAAEVCHNLRMELSGFGPPPYEVTCSALGKTDSFTWRSGRESANCYFWGSGFTVVAWVNGVRSNDLWWEPAAPAAVAAPPPAAPAAAETRGVHISVGSGQPGIGGIGILRRSRTTPSARLQRCAITSGWS